MTATLEPTTSPAARVRTLRPWLERVHTEWMQQVLGVINAARVNGAGIWVRWGAVRYLNTTFTDRLSRTRAALERLRPHMADDAAARLWAVGELLELLRANLDRAVALHQSAEDFSAIALKFLRALGCWCREVEQALGAHEWTALPQAAQAEVGRMAGEDRAVGA